MKRAKKLHVNAPAVWAAAGQKGGSGKSTLCVALAWEALQRGWRVLLADADPQATCRTWAAEAFDRRYAVGIHPAHVPTSGAAILVLDADPALQLGWVDEGADRSAPLSVLKAEWHPDLVLIDVPGRLDEVQTAALAVAQLAILPCSQSWVELCALQESADAVRAAMARRRDLYAAVVLNKYRPRTVLGKRAEAAIDAAGLPLLATRIHNRVMYEQCLSAGRGPDRTAGREIQALFDELAYEQRKLEQRNLP